MIQSSNSSIIKLLKLLKLTEPIGIRAWLVKALDTADPAEFVFCLASIKCVGRQNVLPLEDIKRESPTGKSHTFQ